MRSILPLLLILASAVLQADGQGRYIQLASQYAAARIYHEAVVLPGSAGADVLVSYRIPNDRLVFMKDRQPEEGREFVASFEVTVRIRSGGEAIDARTVRSDHYAADFDATRDRSGDYQGVVRFHLQPGEYAYFLELKDLNAEREGRSEPRRFDVPALEAPSVLAPIMAEARDSVAGGARLRLVNLSGSAPYGRPFLLGIPVMLGEAVAANDVRLTYSVRPEKDQSSRRALRSAVEPVSGTVQGAELMSFETAEVAGQFEGFLLFTAPTAESGYFLAAVEVPGESLPDGDFVAEVTLLAGDEQSTSRLEFSTHWRDMPISLHDLDVAISNLSFIEDRSVIRRLSRGTRDQREQAFFEYWRERDPTPEREFNELMAEYYRRIDHAAFAFRTGAEPVPDGLRTDRAQIYILHGEPQSVSRELPGRGSGVREIWTYDDGRIFVFEAASSLDRFRLVQS